MLVCNSNELFWEGQSKSFLCFSDFGLFVLVFVLVFVLIYIIAFGESQSKEK